MSTLKVTNIQATGETASRAVAGVAAVKGSKNASGSSILGTLNVSSLDDDGTGDFGINFTNAFANANYQANLTVFSGVSAGNSDGHFAEANSKTTSSIETQTWYGDSSTNATFIDWAYDIIIHGDLA